MVWFECSITDESPLLLSFTRVLGKNKSKFQDSVHSRLTEQSAEHRTLKVNSKKNASDAEYLRAVRSFAGFLTGVGKSPATVEAYVRDLKTFRKYFSESLTRLTVEDLDPYPEFLKKEGFKLNTRRRQMLTVRSFLKFLKRRKKLKVDLAARVPSMDRSERFPHTFDVEDLRKKISSLPSLNELELRNRVILWVLLETGCQVSELPKLTAEDFVLERSKTFVRVGDWDGGVRREVPVSRGVLEAVKALVEVQQERRARSTREAAQRSRLLFEGFNKFGPMGSLTPRGVEILVKGYAERFEFPQMKPRNLRHSIVMSWMQGSVTLSEIQYRLGLKSDYALRLYRAMGEAKKQLDT